MQTDNYISFRSDVTLTMRGENLCVESKGLSFPWEGLSDLAVAALRKINQEPATPESLREPFLNSGRLDEWLDFKHRLDLLAPLVCHTLYIDSVPTVRLVPVGFAARYRFSLTSMEESDKYVVSRFAYMRRQDDRWVLESPLGKARAVIMSPHGFELLMSLSEACTYKTVAEKGNVANSAASQFLSYLQNADLLAKIPQSGPPCEDGDQPLANWEFHDLLFHTRSRLGRHEGSYGGTYRFKQQFEPLPLIRPSLSESRINLFKPETDHLSNRDLSFADVAEQRRSIRQHGLEAISVQQLGEFLFRTARVVKVYHDEVNGQSLCFRPYASGGAIHELEIYPIIRNCRGLEAGLYRYDPIKHTLEEVSKSTKETERILLMASQTLHSDPQVLLVISARFQRLQWKYESMAYALLLKNVGALYQTMSLTATAMRLAGCPLGGGDSDLFAAAVGLDYYAETSVGEFALGSRVENDTPVPFPYGSSAESSRGAD